MVGSISPPLQNVAPTGEAQSVQPEMVVAFAPMEFLRPLVSLRGSASARVIQNAILTETESVISTVPSAPVIARKNAYVIATRCSHAPPKVPDPILSTGQRHRAVSRGPRLPLEAGVAGPRSLSPRRKGIAWAVAEDGFSYTCCVSAKTAM